jgi:predicted nuclease with TOPRIM domain
VPELGRDDVREVFVRTYRIVYEVREDAIHVLAVLKVTNSSSVPANREDTAEGWARPTIVFAPSGP